MGDIFHCDAMSNDLRQRIGTQQIVAKVMTAGSDASFLQEVAIMALFLGHNNFVI